MRRVDFWRQSIVGQLAQILDGAIDGFDPGFAATQFIVEARILVVELELLQLSGEIARGCVKCFAHFVGNRALNAHFGVLGTIENVMLGRLIFAGGLQNHLHNVLNTFDGRQIVLGGDNVDDAVQDLLDRASAARFPGWHSSGAGAGRFARRSKDDDTAVALDDLFRHGRP